MSRSLQPAAAIAEVLTIEDLRRHAETVRDIGAGPGVIGYAVALADATRHPEAHGLAELAELIEFGASPPRADRGSSRPPGCWRCCAGAARSPRPTSAISPPTCCATGSSSPMTR